MTSMSSQGRLLCSLSMIIYSIQAQAEEFIIDFQHPLQDKPLSTYTVEIANYDVTRFASFEDSAVVVNVQTDLPPGNYDAYVVAYYEDGEIETLAETNIQIDPKNHTQWAANSTLSTQYRIAEDDETDYSDTRAWQTSGAFEGYLNYRNGKTRVNTHLQAVYDTLRQGHTPENEWQLADYQATVARDGSEFSTGIQAGNNHIEQTSLLFSDYRRRGINLFAKRHDDRFKASMFTAVSEPTNSAEDELFWSKEEENRTIGGTLSFSPLRNNPERLVISSSYVDGKGKSTGSGFTVVDEETVYGGDGWGVSLDSIWLNRSLWLHLENASSNFDSDGLDYGDDAIRDDAAKLLVQLNSGESMPTLGLDYWQLNLQRQRVGEYFYSIANLALPGDLIADQATFSGGIGAFGVNIDLQNQKTNESDRPDRATRYVDYRALDLFYSPAVDTTTGIWSVLGSPGINAYYHRTGNSQPDADRLLSGMDIDNTQQEYSIGVTLSHNTWNWGLSYARTDVEDRSEAVSQNGIVIYTPQGDTTNHMATLQLAWYPTPRFSITPQLQWNRYLEALSDNEYETLNAGFDTRVEFLPNKLWMNLNYFYSRFDYQYGNPEYLDSRQNNHTGNLQINWKAIQAAAISPGMDVFLKGSYGRQDDSAHTNEYENWQIMLGFNIYWSDSNED